MQGRTEFKRMVLGLPQSASDYPMVGMIAKLAELLHLSLVGMFMDDRSLMHIAGLSCVRELRSVSAGWQPIDIDTLATELDRGAATAHRLFTEAVQSCSVETSFRVEKGLAGDVIGALATAQDIIVVIEPKNPAERVTQQFTRLVGAAFQAAAAVMVVPSRIARFAGPIIAVARNPEDSSINVAVRLAAAAREKLVIVGPSDILGLSSSISNLTLSVGAPVELAPIPAPLKMMTVAGDLRRWNERLVVMSRGTLKDSEALALASFRSIPVVITEPPRAADVGKQGH
jgi:hypothetical protein